MTAPQLILALLVVVVAFVVYRATSTSGRKPRRGFQLRNPHQVEEEPEEPRVNLRSGRGRFSGRR